ncbi:MAG: DUF2064 domain-containing protein [Bacteriovoracaceae bacterium]|nr:DUF2064 domain-containing protein [Bacteriovoracaceae bacterium]
MSVALAIFVKTPELSPIKTRLANTIGKELAVKFYIRSLKATAAMVNAMTTKIDELEIFWAVAEMEGLKSEYWNEFMVIGQGTGSLGERLSFVYDELIQKHDAVFFIGADSPHLDYLKLVEEIKSLDNNDFIIGETDDGGFYLFGGTRPLPKSTWTSVEYSVDSTSSHLCQNLKQLGQLTYISKSFDIDEFDDFSKYEASNFLTDHLLPEQKNIIEWIKNHIRIKNEI